MIYLEKWNILENNEIKLMCIYAEIVNVRLELYGIYGRSPSYNIEIVHLHTLQTSQYLSHPTP